MLTACIYSDVSICQLLLCIRKKPVERTSELFIARDVNSQDFPLKFQQAVHTSSSLNLTYMYAVITACKDRFFQFFLEQI
jgi:hypothetical protein